MDFPLKQTFSMRAFRCEKRFLKVLLTLIHWNA